MLTVQSASSPPRRRLILLLAIAALLAAIAGIRWFGAIQAEQNLETASLEQLQALAGQQPENARVFHYLGLRARGAGKASVALNAFWKAVQLAPDSEEDWLGWAAAARDDKGPQAADQVLEAYLKRQPHSAHALLERAKLYRLMEYHQTAYQYASEAAKADPKLVEAWGIMAEQAREQRDYATAADAARHAVALAPQDWRCHLEIGKIQMAERRTADAVTSLRQAARLAPERAVAHLFLGLGLLAIAQSQSDFGEVRESLQAAARLQDQLGPHDRFTLALSLGQSYQREARWTEALGPLQEAAKLEPGDETVHYTLAQVYRGLGDKVRAAYETQIHEDIARYHASIRYLLLQISGAPKDPAPRLKLAHLYTSRGNTVDAIKLYKGMVASKLMPEVAERELHALEQAPSRPPQ